MALVAPWNFSAEEGSEACYFVPDMASNLLRGGKAARSEAAGKAPAGGADGAGGSSSDLLPQGGRGIGTPRPLPGVADMAGPFAWAAHAEPPRSPSGAHAGQTSPTPGAWLRLRESSTRHNNPDLVGEAAPRDRYAIPATLEPQFGPGRERTPAHVGLVGINPDAEVAPGRDLLIFHGTVYFTRWLFQQQRGAIQPWVALMMSWTDAKPCLQAVVTCMTGVEDGLRVDAKRPHLLEPVGSRPPGRMCNCAVGSMIVIAGTREEEFRARKWASRNTAYVPVRVAHNPALLGSSRQSAVHVGDAVREGRRTKAAWANPVEVELPLRAGPALRGAVEEDGGSGSGGELIYL